MGSVSVNSGNFFAIVGHSEDVDTTAALEDLLEQCTEGLDGRTPNAALLFSGIDLDHKMLLEGINNAWPGIRLIGCTTDGEISSEKGFCEDSVTLFLFCSDTVQFSTGLGRNLSSDVEAACRQAVAEALSKTSQKPSICLTMPESLTASGHKVVSSLVSEFGSSVPLFGATAGDQYRFKSTRQFHQNEILSDCVPVLLFSGPLKYSVGVATGWKPIGEPGLVTRAEGSTVYEIDGRPAIDFYRKYFGEKVSFFGDCPLAILGEANLVQYLRASGNEADPKTGAIVYFADVPQGSLVQITMTDREAILAGCAKSLDTAVKSFPPGSIPAAAIVFSCAARKSLLGTRVGEEHNAILAKLPASLPVCGFYGYGEVGPEENGREVSRFHNETFVTLLIGS